MDLYFSRKKQSTKDVLTMHLNQQGISSPEPLEMLRTEKGKPYLPAHPAVHFSVSHTGTFWICCVSSYPVGIDIEDPAIRRQGFAWERIAQRYFTTAEQRQAKEEGLLGFLHLWTRKEALAKQKGVGIRRFMSEPSVQEDGQFVDLADDQHIKAAGLIGACCTKEVQERKDVTWTIL